MQYRVWHYLYHSEPFGDRAIAIPSPKQLGEILNMSVRSVYRAFNKLSESGFFKIESTYVRTAQNGIKNQALGTKNYRKRDFSSCVKNVNVADKTGTDVTELTKPCQNWQNETSSASDSNNFETPQTNSDLKQTLSEKKEKTANKVNSQETEQLIDYWIDDKEDRGSIAFGAPEAFVNKEINGKGSSADVEQRDEKEIIEAEIVNVDRSIVKRNSHREGFKWLIEGPWVVEGKLDPNFRDWLAKDWLSRYGGTIHQKRADVLAHFKKDPANLAIRWEQYSSEYLHRYKNTQVRLKNGIEIDDLEQQKLKENVAAVSKLLPAELSPVAKKQPLPDKAGNGQKNKEINYSIATAEVISIEASTQESNQIYGSKDKESTQYLVDFESIPSAEEKPDNPQAYKIWQPEKVEQADPEKVKELMRSFLSKFGGSDRAREAIKEEGSKLEKLNNWLCDEILYPEAIERAKVAGYEIEYSENGKAIRIREPEF